MSEGKSKDTGEFDPLFLLEDEPVPDHNTDELTLLPFAKAIAGAAIGTQGPFTIGVYADWGHGKTSVLRQAKSLIDTAGHKNVVTVWFNAWQYEKEDHPIVPLIGTISNEVRKKSDKPESCAWQSFHRALSALAYGFSAKVNLGVAEVSFSGDQAIDREAALQKAADEALTTQSLYYQAFEKLADFARGKKPGSPKIVVFIDDLDRCLPPQALALLESIKLVLAQRGFIFVMAVERGILESFLAKRYREEFGVENYNESGSSYLDKIVQLPLYLPQHQSRFEGFISGLLARDVFKKEGTNREVAQALEPLKSLLAVGSDHNPRSLVRFINNLIIDSRLMRTTGINEEAALSMCAVSRFLQQHLDSGLYRRLCSSQPMCDRLAEWLAGKTPEDMELKTGTREPPASPVEIIQDKIARKPFLRDILTTEAGSDWLRNEDELRTSVNDFLAREREEASTSPASQHEIIERAMRDVLGKRARAQITEDEKQAVAELRFSYSDISDAGLAHLSGLTGLQSLSLDDTRISDAGLAHLSGLTGLRSLGLSHTRISDAGLAHLSGLTGLQSLSLDGTRISGAGLVHLSNLTNLSNLWLDDTQISKEGLEHLPGWTSLSIYSLNGTHVSEVSVLELKKTLS